MNQKNFTQKSQEAIQAAQMLSREYGNPQIEQAHLPHRKHRQKMWMRCAGKMLLCGNRFTKSFTEFPWYMILRKQCSMWENRPISHKNRYQTAGGCLRWFFHKGIDRKAV